MKAKENEFTPFERFLLDRLLHSAYDCCAVCAENPDLGVCAALRPDGTMEERVCRRGIREYFEDHGDDAEDADEAALLLADRLRDESRDEEALRQLEGGEE